MNDHSGERVDDRHNPLNSSDITIHHPSIRPRQVHQGAAYAKQSRCEHTKLRKDRKKGENQSRTSHEHFTLPLRRSLFPFPLPFPPGVSVLRFSKSAGLHCFMSCSPLFPSAFIHSATLSRALWRL